VGLKKAGNDKNLGQADFCHPKNGAVPGRHGRLPKLLKN
jgi:hypothetical protein